GICRTTIGILCTADCPGVCGCDGKFYCNACVAHVAGTDDSTDRSCLRDAGGKACGGPAGAPGDPGFFCDFSPNQACGQGDAQGVCQPRPQVCTADCPGVCGCDGKFYCNECSAQQAGTDVSPFANCARDR